MQQFTASYAGWQCMLSGEENDALLWRIGMDFQCACNDTSNPAQLAEEEHYIQFAFNFYTRSRESIDDIVMQYRTHFKELRAKTQAEAFMHDILNKIRSAPVAHAA